jgi:uncharacterized protein YihD (DUF1040 family)
MRDPRRIERILALIKELWILSPDQRLGQLLGNYAMTEARQEHPMFYIEDDIVEARLRDTLREAAAILVERRSEQ